MNDLEYFCAMAEAKTLLLFGIAMVVLSYGLGCKDHHTITIYFKEVAK